MKIIMKIIILRLGGLGGLREQTRIRITNNSVRLTITIMTHIIMKLSLMILSIINVIQPIIMIMLIILVAVM